MTMNETHWPTDRPWLRAAEPQIAAALNASTNEELVLVAQLAPTMLRVKRIAIDLVPSFLRGLGLAIDFPPEMRPTPWPHRWVLVLDPDAEPRFGLFPRVAQGDRGRA